MVTGNVIVFARWRLCKCLPCLYYCLLLDPTFHISGLFAKLLYLILVSFHCNSPIIVHYIGIFIRTDNIPLFKVNFLYVSY